LIHCLKDYWGQLSKATKLFVVNIFQPFSTHASILTGKEISLYPHFEVVGEENTVHVDYAIKALEELICITEGKQHQISIGFAQNLLQCEGAYQINKKKRKADDAFGEDYDYLFGIVTTATEWYFLLYISESISCTSEIEYHISLTKTIAKEENEAELRKT